jgi:hypothetical protein
MTKQQANIDIKANGGVVMPYQDYVKKPFWGDILK